MRFKAPIAAAHANTNTMKNGQIMDFSTTGFALDPNLVNPLRKRSIAQKIIMKTIIIKIVAIGKISTKRKKKFGPVNKKPRLKKKDKNRKKKDKNRKKKDKNRKKKDKNRKKKDKNRKKKANNRAN